MDGQLPPIKNPQRELGAIERKTMQTGKTLRDEGIKQSYENAEADWKSEAYEAILKLCSTVSNFTADDVWALLKSSTNENRAMGGVMMRAQSAGLIRPLDMWKQTTRRSSHCRPLRVWEVIK